MKGPGDGIACCLTLRPRGHPGCDTALSSTRRRCWGSSVPLHAVAQNYFLQLRENAQSSPNPKFNEKDTRLSIPVPEVTKQRAKAVFNPIRFPQSRLPGTGGPEGRRASRGAHGGRRGAPRKEGCPSQGTEPPGPVSSSLREAGLRCASWPLEVEPFDPRGQWTEQK